METTSLAFLADLLFALSESGHDSASPRSSRDIAFDPQPVYVNDQPIHLVSRHNTGIVISYDINYAICANLIGFGVPRT